MHTSLDAYQYTLPEELIAQEPCSPRDQCRLLVIDRATQTLQDRRFDELPQILQSGDRLVFNDTKVIPARLIGKRETGGKAEVFLLRIRDDASWEAMVKPAKKLGVGAQVVFGPDFSCEVIEEREEGVRVVKFLADRDFDMLLEKYGAIPLPPYIRRDAESHDDEDYQTVFAHTPGAVAAPTAGLHFTDRLLDSLRSSGIDWTTVTLHVGAGTFRPVMTPDIRDHKMHTETVVISPVAAEVLNRPLQRAFGEPGRQICVGTTCCRSVESAADDQGVITAGRFETNLFIYPGYTFKAADALLTNFHLPGSSLLMLVSAFGGYDLMRKAYEHAIKERYRFFSYGDAMLIL